MAKLGSVATGAPRRFAAYSRSNRVPAALLLFGLAVGLWALRRGRLPDRRQTAGWLIGALVVVLAASFVPDLVVGILAAALIGIAIDDSGRIAELGRRLWAMIPSEVSTPLATLPRRVGGIPIGP
jgi:hypothetical protein